MCELFHVHFCISVHVYRSFGIKTFLLKIHISLHVDAIKIDVGLQMF